MTSTRRLSSGGVLRELELTRDEGRRLCALKEAVYGKLVDRALFEWQYFGHPRAAELRVFIIEEGQELVAATTRMPATLRLGGAACPAFFNVDSMVHPSRWRRGYMRELYVFARGALGGSPILFSKGSSVQIYPMLLTIAHRPITPNTSLVSYPSAARWLLARLHLAPASRRGEPRVLPGWGDFRPIERFHDEHDAFFERASPGFGALFVRDAAYMNWRYVDIPHRRYLRYQRVFGGSITSIIVVSTAERQANIVDLLWDPEREDEPGRTVRFAQALCDEHRRARVACFATHPRLRAALTREGFIDRGETPRFSAFIPAAREAAFAKAELHVVDGDGDTEFS